MDSYAERIGISSSQRGIIWFAFFFVSAIVAAGHVLTASRSPTVWQDEVMFADPAINYLMGRGFKTGMWLQPVDTPFAGNSPLYPMLLTLWLKIWGVSILTVRAINYALIIACCGALLWGLCRLKVVRSLSQSLILMGLLYGGYAITFSVRSGRYDILCLLVVSLLVAAFSLGSRPMRCTASLMIGMAVPWTGLQLIPYLVVAGTLTSIAVGRRAWEMLTALAVGSAVGGFAMIGYFKTLGTYEYFRESVFDIGHVEGGVGYKVIKSLSGGAFIEDRSSQLLIVAILIVVLAFWRRSRLDRAKPAIWAMGVGIISLFMVGFAGKSPLYYGWMLFVPLTLGVVALLGDGLESPDTTWIRRIVLGLSVLAMTGYPLRLALTVREWSGRSYARVEAFIQNEIRPGETVMTEWPAYYALKGTASLVLNTNYQRNRPQELLNSVTAVVFRRSTPAPEFDSRQWRVVAEIPIRNQIDKKSYDLVIYRPVESVVPSTHPVPK